MDSWETLNDEALLKWRIKDLKLDPASCMVSPLIQEVLQELRDRGLLFKPRIYFGDEWFSPAGVSAVAVPFFLAHPRLRLLEKRLMLECEGEDTVDFKKLFRHELGHAFDHTFHVSKRKTWQKLFGSPTEHYDPDAYRPRPYSRNFVHNIPQWYAQAHPDEDFAETFAVWLDPASQWQERYKDWGAFKKLEFVEKLCAEFRGVDRPEPRGRMMSDARYLQKTLHRYYEAKRKTFAEDYPDFYDRDLLEIFVNSQAENSAGISAYAFMRSARRELLETVSLWTGERKVTISGLIQRLTHRCYELKLVLKHDERRSLLMVSSFLTTLVTHYLFTGHFRRGV